MLMLMLLLLLAKHAKHASINNTTQHNTTQRNTAQHNAVLIFFLSFSFKGNRKIGKNLKKKQQLIIFIDCNIISLGLSSKYLALRIKLTIVTKLCKQQTFILCKVEARAALAFCVKDFISFKWSLYKFLTISFK